MKISIFAQHLHNDISKLGDVPSSGVDFEFGAKVGITEAEVFTSEFDESCTPESYKQELNQAGINLSGLIATTSLVNPDDDKYQNGLADIKHWIDVAAQIGAKTVMVVPFCDWVLSETDKDFARERMIEALQTLVAYAEPTGVKICIENFSLYAYPYSLVDDLITIFDRVPGLYFIMDAANLYCVRGDTLKLYEALKHRMIKIHAKDWEENLYGSIVRPMLPQLDGCAVGSGIVPMKDVMEHLKADGFQGDCIIEMNAHHISADVIADSAAFLKQYC